MSENHEYLSQGGDWARSLMRLPSEATRPSS